MLQKLEHYGVGGIALNWFKSYISGRTQFVDYEGVHSSTCLITCGVLQGSILGPLLFLLSINDFSNVSSILLGLLFADDSNMFMSGKNPDEMIQTINKEMEKIENWLEINKLTLNISKTHFMYFRNSCKKMSLTQKLMIRGHEIGMVESTKLLGVYLDSRLSWCNHIEYIKDKISHGIGIICKSRKYLNQSTLISLYYAFIYPYLNYCVEVWVNTYKTYTDPLLRLQKIVLCIITGSAKFSHTAVLSSELHIQKLEQIYYCTVQMFMYRYYNNLLPDIFCDFFKLNTEVHSYNTQQHSHYHAHICRLAQTAKNIRYVEVKCHAVFRMYWSYCPSPHCYKKAVKEILLTQENWNLNL